MFKGLKKLQEAYNYFLYKQIVNIVLKKFESIEKLKKREEPAVSKLGSQRYENTPSVFFLKNNIFYGFCEGVERIYLFKNLFERCR